MHKVRVLMPAYNEELSLPPLLERIKEIKAKTKLPIEVLVVNDGSKDATLAIASNSGEDVKVLDLQPNRGLAGAMREGYKKAIEDLADDDIVITMDADDSQHPGLIFRMVTQIWEGSDIVIASRYRSGARIVGLSQFRKVLSLGAGWMFRIAAPINGVRDYTCGYRAFRAGLLKQAHEYYGDKFIEQQGFGCTAEVLLKMRKFNPVVHELPFILRYDQKQGASKMNVGKTIKQTLKLLFQAN